MSRFDTFMSIFDKPKTMNDVFANAVEGTFRIMQTIADESLWMPAAILESRIGDRLRSRERYADQSGTVVVLSESETNFIKNNDDVRRYIEMVRVTVHNEQKFWHGLLMLSPRSYSYGLVWNADEGNLYLK